MSKRLAPKEVVKFAMREFREKHPLSVRVLRVNPETFFSSGFLSSTRIMKKTISNLIVVAEYQNNYRIYSFTQTADLLGAENVQKTEKFKKKIATTTKKIYELPK